jgi:hypothetical protein
MPCKIHLKRPFDRLDETEKNGHDKYDDCHPKGIPLWPPAAIIPPLRYRFRFSFIENLLQDGQTLTPEVEFVDLSALYTEKREFDRATVQMVVLRLLPIPISNTLIS